MSTLAKVAYLSALILQSQQRVQKYHTNEAAEQRRQQELTTERARYQQ